jgi:hypothetical protein
MLRLPAGQPGEPLALRPPCGGAPMARLEAPAPAQQPFADPWLREALRARSRRAVRRQRRLAAACVVVTVVVAVAVAASLGLG